MARSRAVDRALKIHGRGSRVAAGVILAIGLVVVIWFVSPTERKRISAMRGLGVGADTARVVAELGAPTRCEVAGAPLRAGFPGDWPPPAVESALERLRGATAARWLYPINLRTRIPCASGEEHTEIGVGRDGRVLWYIAVTSRTPIQLPDDYTPSGDEP